MTSYLFNGNTRLWMPRNSGDGNQIELSAAGYKEGKIRSRSELADNGNNRVKKKWTLKEINRLLRLYGSHFCLWNARDTDSRIRDLRNAALIDITAAMGCDLKQHQVKNKINVLRATYRYEKRRIKARMKKGAGAKTKLKWFFLADNFLRRVPSPTRKQFQVNSLTGALYSNLDDVPVYFENSESSKEGRPKQDMRHKPDWQFLVEKDESKTSACSPSLSNLRRSIKNNKSKSSKALQFIEHLKSQYLLWHPADNSDVTTKMFKNIAQGIMCQMRISPDDLKKLLRILTETYITEKLKMFRNPHYNPPDFKWWYLTESFLKNLGPQYFITINNNSNNLIENPNISHISKDYSKTSSSLTKSPTKVIWNGLQDDLIEGKWALKHSIKFLRLYGVHRCLWDLQNMNYRSREMRNAAIRDIAAAMGYNLNAERVAKKIKIFRITYMQHRKRMLHATKFNKPIQVQLRWFPLADTFLRPHIGLQSIQLQDQAYEKPQFDLQAVYAALNLIDPELITKF